MPLFGFDEQFTLFGSTPLENQFILEYLPTANGDYVKVYLYGLLQCYHPAQDTSVTAMARELNLTEEEVMAAYRYWERRGLVRRVGDNPPQWRYIGVKQRQLMAVDTVDPAYAEFCEGVYSIFGADRTPTTQELTRAYEWVVDLELPPEVVMMLLTYCRDNNGKHFSFKVAEKLAMQMKDENVRTAEEAGAFFLRDEQVKSGTRAVLRRLGKRRNPSEDEMEMYALWTREWGYGHDAVMAACAATTGGEPTFKYLNGILKNMKEQQGSAMASAEAVQQLRAADAERVEPLKKLLSTMNIHGVTVNEATLSVYDQMRALYPDDVILLAGRECAKRGLAMSDVMDLLQAWKQKGLRDETDVQQYLSQVEETDALVKALYEQWGRPKRVSAKDRELMHKWRAELGMPVETILFVSAFAAGTEKPMLYMDKLLDTFAQQGARTPEAVAAAHAAHQAQNAAQPAASAPKGKVVREQQYEQRAYENSPDIPDWMMARWKEMNGDAQ